MAAAMNGMALHGGVIPYGGTFLVFSDYCRAAIRLSALQNARVIYVMTHDSIGLGEDGPTHQPVEHIQSLRLIPNLEVWRPADAVETAEAWADALEQDGPSVLCLSRQNLRPVRTEKADENLSARGGYVIRACAEPKVILIATGSEVELALDVAERLDSEGIAVRVVSLPNWRRFEAQDEGYRESVLPSADPKQVLRVSIEAGTTFGWERLTMAKGLRFGLDGFGASAPAKDLYDHFGLSVDKIVPQVLARLDELGARPAPNATSDTGTLAEAEAHPIDRPASLCL
jgi:transketolase